MNQALPNPLMNQFNDSLAQQKTSMIELRTMQEIQGSIILAKKFPRDPVNAKDNMESACKRYSVAEDAFYSFKRGGTVVSGLSIRIAEIMAQHWGNLDWGLREIAKDDDETVMEAYCWDLQTNNRQRRTFTVKHIRDTKKGSHKLTDQRDIFEHITNNGMRRVRACILSVMPYDVKELVESTCMQTLKDGNGIPVEDRIQSMVTAFKGLGVNIEMLEKRLGHKMDVTNAIELIDLRKIYGSIRDCMSKREDWFDVRKMDDGLDELNKRFTTSKSESIKEVTVDTPSNN